MLHTRRPPRSRLRRTRHRLRSRLRRTAPQQAAPYQAPAPQQAAPAPQPAPAPRPAAEQAPAAAEGHRARDLAATSISGDATTRVPLDVTAEGSNALLPTAKEAVSALNDAKPAHGNLWL
ncbi:hypothetical protein [Streptomyces sp. NRRL B-1140]|uniref:hypothetical protein n=1 Tax=Streptomyces sp. NRRL B-1140 TaxID=1415549 RepID=UPI000AE9A367|nr:hypothetical protein [Streptomyces sp. NRRL B-1140]